LSNFRNVSQIPTNISSMNQPTPYSFNLQASSAIISNKIQDNIVDPNTISKISNQSSSVIVGKPQLKNLMAEVTQFKPPNLSNKASKPREHDVFEGNIFNESKSKENSHSEVEINDPIAGNSQSTGNQNQQSIDMVYDMFMKELAK
ncbi:MAG: hypothetical protein MHMPM18_001639, partial [Marteilia pararefringens]